MLEYVVDSVSKVFSWGTGCIETEQDRANDEIRVGLNKVDHYHFSIGPIFPILRDGSDLPVTYIATPGAKLQGDPLCTGRMLFLRSSQSSVEVQLTLFSDGLEVSSGDQIWEGGKTSKTWPWSPFMIAERRQAVFRLAWAGHEERRTLVFATSGPRAHEVAELWNDGMSTGILSLTKSLFPSFNVAIWPLVDVRSTRTRIMAGYLLRREVSDVVSLMYCELHPQLCGEARFVLYRDESCLVELDTICLTDQTLVTCRGQNCLVFDVDSQTFCARSSEEKELWLRAVGNVKVKLMFQAPDPMTEEHLEVIREAVAERAWAGDQTLCTPRRGTLASRNPVLTPRAAMLPVGPSQVDWVTPRGDLFLPEPTMLSEDAGYRQDPGRDEDEANADSSQASPEVPLAEAI
mmetsp:Transcript_9715/g.21734  ORF Transcript_9715/g.21734 Transcript_9715/m.21734 type:complete len:404 (-) Transcript_9715:71-1282(-)